LPTKFHKYVGIPLRLNKALYGYTYSGKLLFDEQAEFLRSVGFTNVASAQALWYRHFDDGGIMMILQYSDDFLIASTCKTAKTKFRQSISSRFNVEWKEFADWYLQARITQDREKNITLDQRRYALSIVQKYLPNYPEQATESEMKTYAFPLPTTFIWKKEDCSADSAAVVRLEHEFGFKMRAVVGSLNYLANTAYEELYAIRKACRYMHLPGRRHFKAVLHLLHHIRCHLPKAIKFYHHVSNAPVSQFYDIAQIPRDTVSLRFFAMSDSAFQDSDNLKSTGCCVCIVQGGIVDMNSFVPEPLAMSSAESEVNALTITTMRALHVKFILCEILHGDPCYQLTIPVLTDSKSGRDIAISDRETKHSKHIERRWMYVKYACQSARVILFHIAKTYQLADMGTKNVTGDDAALKLSFMEVTSPDIVKATRKTHDHRSEEG
jgi:Reverse transcriptase (RNA-dependent DNA polymerase)